MIQVTTDYEKYLLPDIVPGQIIRVADTNSYQRYAGPSGVMSPALLIAQTENVNGFYIYEQDYLDFPAFRLVGQPNVGFDADNRFGVFHLPASAKSDAAWIITNNSSAYVSNDDVSDPSLVSNWEAVDGSGSPIVTAASIDLVAWSAVNLTEATWDAVSALAAQVTSLSAPPTADSIAAAVWASTTRTLSGWGTLVEEVWNASVRTVTGGGDGGTSLPAETIDALNAASQILLGTPYVPTATHGG